MSTTVKEFVDRSAQGRHSCVDKVLMVSPNPDIS